MKTIAILACCDTKYSEIGFLHDRIRKGGCRPLVIDVSTSPGFKSPGDISREAVASEIGVVWSDLKGRPKHELLETVRNGATAMIARLYREGAIDGIISIGGLQNTTVGASAMRALPIGVPKVMVSTVASGQRTFDLIVGTSDITVIPSICDFAGLNIISETVLGNAAGAILGMLEHAGQELPKVDTEIVGTTLMGATNDGVVQAVGHLEGMGRKVISFHSTGVGGKVMEELIAAGTITATMDMTLHEIVYEYFGGGFGAGTENRLVQGVEKGIPMLIVPGGIDFICQWKRELFPDIADRKMIWHNAMLAHVKLSVAEVTDISRMIVSRLNAARPGRVVVLFPKAGLRTFAKPGEPLHDPAVDQAIFTVFERELRKDIPLKSADYSIMDDEFSRLTAVEMDALLRRAP
jgi:uncharacterized protein (UPF0261 family)